MIIDTHAHLDDDRFKDDLEEVIKRAKKNRVEKIIIPGAELSTLNRAIDIANSHKDIYFAVGIHPYDIDNLNLDILKEAIVHPKCVAVGECGLDYYRLPKDLNEKKEIKERQKEAFIKQIELANQFQKPLIVHIREASLDSFNILEKYAKYGGVLHCFNASELLLDLANRGFYFGIGGVVTFKNAKKLVEILPKIPLDKMIVETDSPYLTPEPYRGKRNEPAYTIFVVEKIANILNRDPKEIEDITTLNALRLFNLS
ncbi:MAG: TatD family hydrolase [Epsilonproteobacteria bacterium]|nr:TatD family hydrolase [Campylobacterota bacterium]